MAYTNEMGQLNTPKVIKHALTGLVVLILLFGSMGIVGAGERGVKVRLGRVVSTEEPGLYFKIPLIEKVRKMDVKTQAVVYENQVDEDGVTFNQPLFAASKDLQDVQISTVVNYHIDPTRVEEIYIKYRTVEVFEEKVIRPAVRDTVKTSSSGFTAEELVTKRAEFAEQTLLLLNERLARDGVVVEESNITNLQFSASFTAAIEAKVTAVQNAEAAKNQLETVKYEAQQAIESAKGRAEALRVESVAISNNPKVLELRAIEKWDGVLPQVTGGATPFVNLK